MSMPEDKKFSIAFYDSGIGGLPYFERTAALLPGADYCYLADSAHFPLGEKPREEVLSILHAGVRAVVEACAPEIFVIACNTASTIALASLRERHPGIAFVGTVPAIKPAASRSKTGRIAVVATSRTVSDPYTLDLVERFASNVDTRLVAAPEWVEFVERRWLGSTIEERRAVTAPIVNSLLDSGVDEIVLACTHFLFLEDAVLGLAAGRAEVIDSAQGVSRRVQELCRERSAGPCGGEPGARRMLSSGSEPNPGHAAMAARFGLAYGGPLP